MKILEIKELEIPDVKVIRFARFRDERGYFTEHYRKRDFLGSEINALEGKELLQGNESFSKKNVMRGLHFQWNPYMGKLVRTISGHMIDVVLDIRKDSPTYGKAIAYDMPASEEGDYEEWIWVPPGFAHGNFFLENTTIEYFCTGEYSPKFESGISPLSEDLDWSLCNKELREKFENLKESLIISDKDKNAQSLSEWGKSENSKVFIYEDLKERRIS